MKFGLGAKIGLAAGILGGLIGATAGIIASPIFGSIFVIIFAGIWFWVYWSFFRPSFISNKLLKTGQPATAKILEVSDTGVTINQNPQIKLLLEVYPSTGSSYLVETRVLISRLQTASYQPGTMVNVKIDPNDKDKIAIVYGDENISSVNGSNQSPNLNDIKKYQEILMKQDAENQKILASGEPAQATILSYKELNIKVNGNNPAVELLVEVHRTTGPKFLAIAKGIVLEQSVWKYQPGKNVYVKFNPNDLTQVSIDHS